MATHAKHRGRRVRRPTVHPTPLEREAAAAREANPQMSIAQSMREAAEARERAAAQRKRRLRQEQIIREIDSRHVKPQVTLSRELYKRVRLEALDRDRMLFAMRQGGGAVPEGVVNHRGAVGVVEQILRDYFYERDEAEREARRKARR